MSKHILTNDLKHQGTTSTIIRSAVSESRIAITPSAATYHAATDSHMDAIFDNIARYATDL